MFEFIILAQTFNVNFLDSTKFKICKLMKILTNKKRHTHEARHRGTMLCK